MAMTNAISTLAIAQADLTQAITQMVQRQQIAGATHTRAVTTVEKPQAFKGEDLEVARIFRHAFLVWARANPRAFAQTDTAGNILLDQNGDPRVDEAKMIASALSFMQGKAAQWARPHVKNIANGQAVFHNRWTEFETAFQAKFEPIDAVSEAKSVILGLRQDKRDFNSYLAEFEMWSPRTGWSNQDLFDRLKSGLNSEYVSRLSYFQPPAKTWDNLVKYGKQVDIQLQDLRNNLAAISGKPVPAKSSSHTTFRDPNAMDIDASNFDDSFRGLTDREAIKKQWRRVLKDRCSCCGSKAHKRDDIAQHRDSICNHCGKSGHWAKVCLSRLYGEPKRAPQPQAVRANTEASSSGSSSNSDNDHGAELAALKDMLAMQQKQMASMAEALQKAF